MGNQWLQSYGLNEAEWKWESNLLETAWRGMCRIRAFEEKCTEMYKQGLMGGSLHSYIGQEAVATGFGLHLHSNDYITMTYRGRGQALAKGADPYRLFAEMLGRSDGYCKGKGGPMHIASGEHGILGANGIVGAGIPIAVGAGLTAKHNNNGQVAVTFFGDGATNQGTFHEALNLAAVLKLPVIFVCENNLYSEMTPIKDSVLNEHLAERGAAYCMHSVIVDGNDVRAVYEVAQDAVLRARGGGGPTFVEAKTYRLLGHMYGDAESYRTREEVDAWRKKEPLILFKQQCLQKQLVRDERLAEIAAEVSADIERAYEKALMSAEPKMEEIFTDVY